MVLVLSDRIVPCDKHDPDAVYCGRVFGGNIEHIGKGKAAEPAGSLRRRSSMSETA